MSASRAFTARLASKIAETTESRGALYADPEVNFARIAEFWRMWMRWRFGIDVPLTAFDAGMMQAGIKLSRQAETPGHEDSSLDGPAYWLLGCGCAPRKRE